MISDEYDDDCYLHAQNELCKIINQLIKKGDGVLKHDDAFNAMQDMCKYQPLFNRFLIELGIEEFVKRTLDYCEFIEVTTIDEYHNEIKDICYIKDPGREIIKCVKCGSEDTIVHIASELTEGCGYSVRCYNCDYEYFTTDVNNDNVSCLRKRRSE